MGLRLLSAATVLPQHVCNYAQGTPLASELPTGQAHELAIHYARTAVETALAAAGYVPGDIDLMVSKGISPTHVAHAPDVLGPRVSYPLQHELGAKKAFVFDLLDTAWAPALDSIEALCDDMSWNVAVLLHSELSGPSVVADPRSGLALSDGAGALVLERDELPGSVSTFVNVCTDVPPAGIWLALSQEEGSTCAELLWQGSADVLEAMNDALFASLQAHVPTVGAKPVYAAVEQWFGDSGLMRGPAGTPLLKPAPFALGALTVPYQLQLALQEPSPREFLVAGVDPFRLQATCRSLRAGKGNL